MYLPFFHFSSLPSTPLHSTNLLCLPLSFHSPQSHSTPFPALPTDLLFLIFFIPLSSSPLPLTPLRFPPLFSTLSLHSFLSPSLTPLPFSSLHYSSFCFVTLISSSLPSMPLLPPPFSLHFHLLPFLKHHTFPFQFPFFPLCPLLFP